MRNPYNSNSRVFGAPSSIFRTTSKKPLKSNQIKSDVLMLIPLLSASHSCSNLALEEYFEQKDLNV